MLPSAVENRLTPTSGLFGCEAHALDLLDGFVEGDPLFAALLGVIFGDGLVDASNEVLGAHGRRPLLRLNCCWSWSTEAPSAVSFASTPARRTSTRCESVTWPSSASSRRSR